MLQAKTQVKFQFDLNTISKRYDLIIEECSDDIFEQIKHEIKLKIFQQKKILSHEINHLPGINILLDDKNLLAKSIIEEIQSKENDLINVKIFF